MFANNFLTEELGNGWKNIHCFSSNSKKNVSIFGLNVERASLYIMHYSTDKLLKYIKVSKLNLKLLFP